MKPLHVIPAPSQITYLFQSRTDPLKVYKTVLCLKTGAITCACKWGQENAPVNVNSELDACWHINHVRDDQDLHARSQTLIGDLHGACDDLGDSCRRIREFLERRDETLLDGFNQCLRGVSA